jgi:hypothetical protein
MLLYHCVLPLPDSNQKVVDDSSEVQTDTFHLICQFWELSDAENPTFRDVSHIDDDSILFQPGIIFMTDSSVLENPTGEMSYGKFSIHGATIDVNFDDGRKAVYQIGRLHKDELRLKRTEKDHTTELVYTPTHTFWTDAAKNPFAKQNYRWSIRPTTPETNDAVRERVKECAQFYSYYLTGYVDGGATKIDFRALPSCFHWYSGGIGIQNENKLDKKWIHCFFSSEQALEGRQMLDDVISKKYTWDEKETNWIKQSAPVLLQIRDSL